MYNELPSTLRVKKIFRLEFLMKEREGAITWKEERAWRVVEANSIDGKCFFRGLGPDTIFQGGFYRTESKDWER